MIYLGTLHVYRNINKNVKHFISKYSNETTNQFFGQMLVQLKPTIMGSRAHFLSFSCFASRWLNSKLQPVELIITSRIVPQQNYLQEPLGGSTASTKVLSPSG